MSDWYTSRDGQYDCELIDKWEDEEQPEIRIDWPWILPFLVAGIILLFLAYHPRRRNAEQEQPSEIILVNPSSGCTQGPIGPVKLEWRNQQGKWAPSKTAPM